MFVFIDVAANDKVVGTLKTVEETPRNGSDLCDEEDGYREAMRSGRSFRFLQMNYPEIK